MPILFDTAKVFNVDIGFDYDSLGCCPSHLNTGGGGYSEEELLTQYLDQQGESDSLLSALYLMVDGGSTQALNDEVLTSSPPQAFDLLQTLLNDSPYLTDTVMKSAIEREVVLPNEMIRDVLVANPQASQSQEVLEKLDKRFNPMPASMMEEIMANSDSLSPKDELEALVQSSLLAKQKAYNELARFYATDTADISSQENLLDLLEEGDKAEQRYALAYTLYCTGNPEQARAELTQLPGRIDLDDAGWVQYAAVDSFFDVIFQIDSANRTLYQVSDQEAAQLNFIASNSLEPARSWAINLLEINGRYFNQEQVLIPGNLKSVSLEAKKPNIQDQPSDRQKLYVYPNPARNFVVIEYNINRRDAAPGNLQLKITDLENGRSLDVKKVEYLTGQILFDVRDYVPGVYLVLLTERDYVLETAKFVIQPD